jgi:hypothetical protein
MIFDTSAGAIDRYFPHSLFIKNILKILNRFIGNDVSTHCDASLAWRNLSSSYEIAVSPSLPPLAAMDRLYSHQHLMRVEAIQSGDSVRLCFSQSSRS